MTGERLSPSIFEKFALDGRAEDLFGEEGKIMRSGRFYSLNRGPGFQGQRLTVLDTEKKSLWSYTFNEDTGKGETVGHWVLARLSFDSAFTPDEKFVMADDFISKMKGIYSDLDDDEYNKVTNALSEAVSPIIDSLRQQWATVGYRIDRLTRI
jgi:hypothetical protein